MGDRNDFHVTINYMETVKVLILPVLGTPMNDKQAAHDSRLTWSFSAQM